MCAQTELFTVQLLEFGLAINVKIDTLPVQCPVMDVSISVQAELFSCPVLGRTMIGPATARRFNLSTIPIRKGRRATFLFFRHNHKISWFLVSTFSYHAYLFS